MNRSIILMLFTILVTVAIAQTKKVSSVSGKYAAVQFPGEIVEIKEDKDNIYFLQKMSSNIYAMNKGTGNISTFIGEKVNYNGPKTIITGFNKTKDGRFFFTVYNKGLYEYDGKSIS